MDPTTPSSTDNVRALHSRYWERTGLPLDIIRPCIQYLEEHNSNSNNNSNNSNSNNNNNKGGKRRTRVPRLPRLKHGRLAKLLTTGGQYHNNSSYNRRYNSPLDLLNHIRREKRALDPSSSGVVVIASSSADVSLASKLLDREQSENENENATLDTFSLVGEIRRVLVLADDIVRSSIEFPREQRLARRRPMLRFDDDDFDDDDYDDDDYDDCDYDDCDYHDYHDQDDSHQLDTIDEELCLPQPSSSGFRDGAFEMDKDYGCRIRTDLDVDVDVDVHVDIEDEEEDEENPTNASECHNEHEFEHYPPSGMDSSWSLPSMTTFDWVSDANTIFDTEGEGEGEYDIIPESAEARDGIITDNYNDDDNNDNDNNNNNNNENDDDNESAWSVLTGCETVHSMGNLGDGRMVSYSAAVRLGISGARKQTRESTTETRSAPPVTVTDAAIAAIAAPVPVPVHEDDPNGRDGSARNDVDDDDDRDRAFDDVSIYEGAKSGRGGRASRLFKGNIRHQKSSSTCRVRNQRRANSSRSPAPRKQDKKTRTHAVRNNTDC